MSNVEMNINGKNGVYILGGWWVEVENGEFEDVDNFLDKSDRIQLNIDFQQDQLKVIKKHPQYPTYDIVLATNGKYYSVHYGTDKELYEH